MCVGGENKRKPTLRRRDRRTPPPPTPTTTTSPPLHTKAQRRGSSVHPIMPPHPFYVNKWASLAASLASRFAWRQSSDEEVKTSLSASRFRSCSS